MTSHDVIRLVAARFGVSRAEILGFNRSRNFVRARFTAIWILRRAFRKSSLQVARTFSRRDHSSILNAEQRAELFFFSDLELRAIRDELIQEIKERLQNEERTRVIAKVKYTIPSNIAKEYLHDRSKHS